jgi:putative oxidoreductase
MQMRGASAPRDDTNGSYRSMRDSSEIESGLRDYLFSPGISRAPEIARGEVGSRIFNPYLMLVFRLILAGVFIYAALQKIGGPLMFADEIRMYGFLDRGVVLYIVAVVLPWIELLCGISLITGIFLRGSAFILVLFNAIFLAVVSFRSMRIMSTEGTPFMDIFFDCGCGFGVTYAWKKLIEDAILFLLALALFLAPVYRFVLVPIRRKR